MRIKNTLARELFISYSILFQSYLTVIIYVIIWMVHTHENVTINAKTFPKIIRF